MRCSLRCSCLCWSIENECGMDSESTRLIRNIEGSVCEKQNEVGLGEMKLKCWYKIANIILYHVFCWCKKLQFLFTASHRTHMHDNSLTVNIKKHLRNPARCLQRPPKAELKQLFKGGYIIGNKICIFSLS